MTIAPSPAVKRGEARRNTERDGFRAVDLQAQTNQLEEVSGAGIAKGAVLAPRSREACWLVEHTVSDGCGWLRRGGIGSTSQVLMHRRFTRRRKSEA